MSIYTKIKADHLDDLSQMNRKYTLFGFIRFICILVIVAAIYYYLKLDTIYLWIPAIIALVSLIVVVKKHQQLANKMKFTQTLVDINDDEISYLNNEKIPFKKGVEFKDHKHNYTHDLDIFGPHSLFQNLNRTGTFVGKQRLAKLFSSLLSKEEIEQNQFAVKELAGNIEWRQDVLALARLTNDNQTIFKNLINWSKSRGEISQPLRIASYIMPILVIATGILGFALNNIGIQYIAGFLVVININILFKNLKKLRKELFSVDKIHEIISSYALILEKIESEKFESVKLKELKLKLKSRRTFAYEEIHSLSSIFSSLDSVQNIFGAVIVNGISLHHIHVYHKLLTWKNEHAQHISQWMEVIGEIEALNSLANFSYNNPTFCFPKLNSEYNLEFKDLGHPLLDQEVRICNDISFNPTKFIILTGSNMSGKSTFLRSLGVNMVLAGIGSAICATSANIHPLNIFVSMRLSDSLAENESYFFAEVKRLKQVMEQLKDQRGFVLLDEILRGTNSDDKRSGTIEVIKKMVEYKAIGSIATHDIEVCKTTDLHPNYLINKRFETEMVNDELYFDYKIKDGICQNKSAYYLMKKMEII